MNTSCRYCNALKWPGETPGLCCANGKVSLPLIEEPPEPLRELLRGNTDDSRYLLSHIRHYNNAFQMTSFGSDKVIRNNNFCTSFTAQGQVYHKIGSLLPLNNNDHCFLQIYFMGNTYL